MKHSERAREREGEGGSDTESQSKLKNVQRCQISRPKNIKKKKQFAYLFYTLMFFVVGFWVKGKINMRLRLHLNELAKGKKKGKQKKNTAKCYG